MDKIVSALLKDISFRKVNKKAIYPTAKINPRATSFTSTQQLHDMKSALEDEVNGIMQVAFLPQSEEEARRTVVVLTEGEDIPDNTGRPRDERRRPNLTVNTNTCTTDRPTHTVNFDDREQHRTTAITEVQQTLMNYSTNNDWANNTNACPDHPDHNPWPRNNKCNRDNQSSASSDTESIGHWDNNWADQKCSACGNHGHNSWNCAKKQGGELYCNRCRKDMHCNATCSILHGLSTPRSQHQYPTHPSPRTNDNYTVPPVEPNYTNRPSPTPSNAGNIADVTQMFVTHLNENRQQTSLFEHRKDLLANVATYNGKDRKRCLMWINQLKHTAVQAKMPLKELLAAKAGPIVMSEVSSFLAREPGVSDSQVKQMILESFSNIGTRTEAFHYLKKMRLDNDESLLAHNAEYAAIHEAAHGLAPESQPDQHTFLDYTKTLTESTSELLTRQIVRDDTKIHTLRQAMDAAERIHKQVRQEEITKLERSTMRETTISEESINEMSLSKEVNFMSPGRADNHFNSTMKSNGGCWNNSPRGKNNSYYNNGGGRNNSHSDNNGGGRNNSYSDNKNWNSRYNYSNNYDSRRRLNRYRHQPRDPKNKVKFEYNIADRDMMSNLRRTVDNLKSEPQVYRNKFKQVLPRISNRSQEEVCEDAIAKSKIEEIQEILKEDLDLIFDALVIQHYIDEVDV